MLLQTTFSEVLQFLKCNFSAQFFRMKINTVLSVFSTKFALVMPYSLLLFTVHSSVTSVFGVDRIRRLPG